MIQIFLLAPGAAPATPSFTVSGFNRSYTPTGYEPGNRASGGANFAFGGSPTGNDSFIGVRTATTATKMTSGLGYEIGLGGEVSQFASNHTSRVGTCYAAALPLSGRVRLDLAGMLNTASSTTPCATGAPFPTILGGIHVLNCFAAPVTFIVPDPSRQNPIATIQIMNGSTLSNIVTALVYKTMPELLTFNPVGGIGVPAARGWSDPIRRYRRHATRFAAFKPVRGHKWNQSAMKRNYSNNRHDTQTL